MSQTPLPGLVTQVNEKTIEMQCLPLYTLLLAMGNPTVHFFSLDIEGGEFPVLRTIPWEKVSDKKEYIFLQNNTAINSK